MKLFFETGIRTPKPFEKDRETEVLNQRRNKTCKAKIKIVKLNITKQNMELLHRRMIK